LHNLLYQRVMEAKRELSRVQPGGEVEKTVRQALDPTANEAGVIDTLERTREPALRQLWILELDMTVTQTDLRPSTRRRSRLCLMVWMRERRVLVRQRTEKPMGLGRIHDPGPAPLPGDGPFQRDCV